MTDNNKDEQQIGYVNGYYQVRKGKRVWVNGHLRSNSKQEIPAWPTRPEVAAEVDVTVPDHGQVSDTDLNKSMQAAAQQATDEASEQSIVQQVKDDSTRYVGGKWSDAR